MDINENILRDERYKAQIDSLDKETLKLMVEDHIKALEYARKGIEEKEPEKVNDVEYLEAIANGMQKLAKIILEKPKSL